MKKLELDLLFKDKKLVSVELDDKKGLIYTYEDKSTETYPTYADELYFTWLEDAIARNQLEMATKVLTDISTANKREVVEEAEEPKPEEEPVPGEPTPEPKDKVEFKTIKDVYTYITNKDNPLNKDFILNFKDELGPVETLGGQAFHVSEVILPVDDRDKIYCRMLLGLLDGTEDNVFIALPTSWESVASLEDIENISFDELNDDISLNLVVSEPLVFNDADTFNKELGDLYITGNAFLPKEDLPTDGEPTPEPKPEEEPTPEPSKPVDAEVKDLETDITDTEFNFESFMKYSPKASELWLNEFTTTDKFPTYVQALKEKFDKYLKKSLREHVSVLLSEKSNFIAIRIDKEGLLKSTISNEWFKQRLSKVCEAVHKYSDNLRIVETRGSYYTRTFFLVEAIPSNYCLSETDEVKEVDLRSGKTIFESQNVILNEAFLSVIAGNEKGDSFITKPGLKTRLGKVVENYKVNNDNKVPYLVHLDEGSKIVFINESIEPIKEVLTEDEPAKEEFFTKEEFLDWHDGKGGINAPWEALEKIYKIFTDNGADPEEDVDISYEHLPDEKKLEVTKIIKSLSESENPQFEAAERSEKKRFAIKETTQPSDVTPDDPVGDEPKLKDYPWDYSKDELNILLDKCEEQVEAIGGDVIRAALLETKLGKQVACRVYEDYGFVCPCEQFGVSSYNSPFIISDAKGNPTSFGEDNDDKLYKIASFLLN